MRSCLKKENKSRHSLIGLSFQEAEAGKLPDPRSSEPCSETLVSRQNKKPAQSLDSSAWELRQEGCWELEISLDYTVRVCFKERKQRYKKE